MQIEINNVNCARYTYTTIDSYFDNLYPICEARVNKSFEYPKVTQILLLKKKLIKRTKGIAEAKLLRSLHEEDVS